ncbi:CC0125/CC1285 family lipoprotein [Candidatus Binatus sp.]|uniref:CC0125/CC1285 family lipoprotein n=1 Tax=Candidatus Binatus sp. TaxID=2811406 RepID=UPI003BAE8576
MKIRISLIALSAACLLASCATAYQPDGVSGGYTDQVRNGNVAKVSFRGNGLTPPESVHSYILRRCAELTIEDGYSYFVLVHIQAPSAETDNLYSMKIETATIEMYPGIKPQHLANAYDAISTLRTILAEQGESEEPLPSSVVASDDKVASANAVALSAARSTTVANPNPNALTNEAVQFDHW